jgi:hypothetical protein
MKTQDKLVYIKIIENQKCLSRGLRFRCVLLKFAVMNCEVWSIIRTIFQRTNETEKKLIIKLIIVLQTVTI